MTKADVIHDFWSSFGLTAYEENSVPTGKDAPVFHYITYQLVTDTFGSDVVMSASLWYRSEAWKDINAKVEEISKDIGRGGKMLKCNGGAVWIRRGHPFAQSMGDANDDLIKRKYINISAEYLTAD